MNGTQTKGIQSPGPTYIAQADVVKPPNAGSASATNTTFVAVEATRKPRVHVRATTSWSGIWARPDTKVPMLTLAIATRKSRRRRPRNASETMPTTATC